MKKVFLLLLCVVSFSAAAQLGTSAPWMETFNDTNRTTEPTFEEILTAFDAYWADKDKTVKGSGYKPFKRWESLYENYLNEDGTVMSHKQLWDAWQSINNTARAAQADDSNWTNIGPLTYTNTGSWSAGQGRVNTFAIDPIDASIQYVGTPAGGIWKSTNGGADWAPLSDQLPQIGVSGIAIDPTDTQIIYIATGDDDGGDSSSVGVMKSIDGGLTWTTTGLDESNTPSSMNEIYFDPADSKTLWVATNSGVFKTTDSGVNWTNTISGDFDDLKIKPGSSTVLYAADASRVFKSEDAGETWTNISSGTISGAARIVMDVTPVNPEVLYIFTSDNSFGSGEIYKSSDSGVNFTRTYDGSVDIFESTQAWYDFAFAVSDTNEDEIYTGILNVWKSTNGGADFTKLNNWDDPNGIAYTHADIHNLRFINGTLYCGSDGGFYSTTDGGATFTSFTDGLAIGQFYKIDVAATDPSLISGGLQDNGGYARQNGDWQNYYGADGMENVFDPNDPSKVYGFTQNGGGLYFSTTGGGALDGSYASPDTNNNNQSNGNWITPLNFAKDGKLYAAYQSLYELDFCANGWVQRSSSFGQRIDRLETDPNNAEIIYVAVNNNLHRSSDSGVNFTLINSFEDNISSLEVKHGDSETLYITIRGTAGKVYRGTVSDSDIALTDITGSLPNIPKLVIKHQNLHTNNPLFLGTALGVWRYDDITNDWETFDTNLPNTAVRDLDINEANGILTAGTYGRGIWQTAIDFTAITMDVVTTSLAPVSNQSITCSEVPFLLGFKNFGTETISSATITYEAGGIQNTLEWTGSLASQEETTVELPVLGLDAGVYELVTSIGFSGDQMPDNNERSAALYINSTGTADISNDFEEEEDTILVLSANGDTSCSGGSQVWQRGIPSGTLLNEAASGDNVYGTELSGEYPNNTKEYLTTACYDISTLAVKEISFNMAFDLEFNWDILYMEYTTDEGSTWNILGTAADSNWYNSSTVPGTNCSNCPGAQWTGTEADFALYSYDLSPFASETNMIFRFVFHSDQAVTNEGVVIDDLTIGEATLSTEEVQVEGLSIYPNPSTGIFTIRSSQVAPLTIEIYDMLGKVVLNSFETTPGNTATQIDMSSFASGLYLLKLNTGEQQITKKLILN